MQQFFSRFVKSKQIRPSVDSPSIQPAIFTIFQQKLTPFFIWIFYKVKFFYFSLDQHISHFVRQYHRATPKERFVMVRKPLISIILALFIFSTAPFFIPPTISTGFPDRNATEVPLDAKIEIIFSKEMLRSSVEKSFSISPAIKGIFTWENNQKVVFSSDKLLQRATHYTVRMNGLVLSSLFIPLLNSKNISFETLGNPTVVVASPSNEALGSRAPITVIFDRAMIPLTTAADRTIKQPAFIISPPINGEGRWLGTTAYQFRPSESYKQATTYTVTIPKNLHSQDGGVLVNGYSWTFSSEKPRIITVSPDNSYHFVSPNASIAAFFNQSILPASIEKNFFVYDSNGHKVDGQINITDNIVGFYAKQPLERNKYYQVVISKGILGTEGPNGMEEDYHWMFSIAPIPKVISTNPSDKSSNVTEQNSIAVNFISPMDQNSFAGNVTINPPPDVKPLFNFGDYDNTQTHSLSIGTYLGRSKHYIITIGPNVKDSNGTLLGNTYTFSFDTAPYLPSLNILPFNTYFGSFNQQVTPRIVTQVVNSNKLSYTLYKLKREDLLDLYRKKYGNACFGSGDLRCSNWQSYDTSKLEEVRAWDETFSADENNPVNVVTKVNLANGSNIPSGFYFLDIKIPQGAHDNMVMIVSKSTLTVKKSDSQLFAWSVNQSSSNVIPSMKLQLTDSNGNILTEGNTNNDGVLMKNVDLFQKDDLFVFGQKDDDTVVAATAWHDGINIYDFGLPSYYNISEQKDYNVKQDYKQYVTLDRPIYRPGQTIYFKGVVRKDTDGAYAAIVPGTPINVTITDADNRELYKKDLPLSSFGSFTDSFVLSKNGNLGMYQVNSTFNGNTYTQQFQVEEYKKQDLSVTVNPSKDNYLQAEKASIDINASYYFGAPVTTAPVTWTVQTQDYTFTWNKDTNYEFGDPDSYWNLPWYGNTVSSSSNVTEGSGTTDAHGNFTVSLPLDISKYSTSQTYILEATVNDNNNQSIAASKAFTIHKAAIYAGLKPENYGNAAGQAANVDIATVDYKGNELGNTPVTVNFYKRTWDTVREQNPDDGMFYYTSKSHDVLVSTTTATTNSLGRGIATFTPTDGGTYKVTAIVTDKNGNTNTSGSFLWVWGNGFTIQQENNDRIIVATDKQAYNTGDMMSVFVASPFASSSAKTLLTAERGSVLDYKIVDTNSTSNNFKLPANTTYVPNAFIGAILVKGGNDVKNPAAFKIGYTSIKVTDPKKHVVVTITSDKNRYKPQDKLHATIETKDLNGNPISTEVAVGLVDKSVWDLAQIELPEIYQTFYEPRNLAVSTAQLLTISIDRVNANTNLGAKGGSGGGCFTGDTTVLMKGGEHKFIKDIKIGDEILTRASSTSSQLVATRVLQTYKHLVDRYLILNGKIKVTPEHKMLINYRWMVAGDIIKGDKLLDKNNKEITIYSVEQIMGKFTVYNLETETYHTYFADDIYVHNQKGGADTSRRNFPDTAYWNPSVVTNNDGKADITIPLPDSLTTWRLAAIANSSVDSFGSNTAEVTVSRDLLIRPFVPRFLSIGDHAQLGAIIVNTSGSDQMITTSIKTDGIQVNDALIKQQTITDGGQVKVLWPTTALQSSKGTITITVTNADGSLHDAVTVKLPIQSYSTPETVAVAGEAKTYAQEKITLPKGIDTTQGKLDISLSPALGASGLNSLSYLYSYPYFCTEQTTSRFMPSIYVYHMMATRNITTIEGITRDQVSGVIIDGIQRLNTLQHSDGGWGWWTEDLSDPFLSAYAYSGLLAAKKEKFTVSDATLQSARNYLERELSLSEAKLSIDSRAYILYVLKDNANNLSSYASNLYERRFELSTESRAYIAQTLLQIPGMEKKGASLIQELVSLVKKTATTSHWEEGIGFKQDSSTFSGTVSTTAHVLEAILAYNKNNPLITETVRYLLTSRKDNHWPSTFDSAAAIKALALVADTTSSQILDESFKTTLNGKIITSGKFADKDIFSIIEKSLSLNDISVPGMSNIQFAKSGSGNLYYNINLNYFLPLSEVPPLDQGIVVIRDFVDENGKILNKKIINQDTEVWERLTIVAPDARHFVAVEDMLPAGLESVNESLKNTAVLNKVRPKMQSDSDQFFYFDHREYHDDRTSLFASYLPAGVYEFTYRLRATIPGRYHFLPARAYEMYTPDISGHSDGGWIEVR